MFEISLLCILYSSASRLGVRLKVHRLDEAFSVHADNPDSRWRKGRILRYASSQCGDFFFCLADVVEGRLQATRASLCLWRHSRSRNAHPLTFSCRRERMRCRVYVRGGKLCGCVCVCGGGEGTEQGGWGCCESRLMHRAGVSSRCTWRVLSSSRVLFSQPLCIFPICRRPEMGCSLIGLLLYIYIFLKFTSHFIQSSN